MTHTEKLQVIRASEEIKEHGSIAKAIEAVERQIASPESVPAERRFMRRVLYFLRLEEVRA